VTDGWYRTFFDQAANDHWNAALPESFTAGEVAFLADRLGLGPGDIVLDLPAGRGRLALPLADLGIRVVAADISDDGTRGLLAAVGERPVLVVRADMQAVPLRTQFDAAYCMGNSFGYFPIEGVERFLAEVARLLRPDGAFAMESATVAESMAASFAETTEHDFGGVRVVARHRMEPERERIVSELEVTDSAGTRTLTTTQLVLPSARIAALVAAAGLEVEALLGGTDGTPYDETAGSLVVVARRPT
jgi:cyclopropane fatty-acyl-phospholipid synthase-like methyltransferase